MRSSSRGGSGGGGGESKNGKGERDGDREGGGAGDGEESRNCDGLTEESQATTQATAQASSQASSQATEATAMVIGGDTLDTLDSLAAATADAMAVATAVATAAAAATAEAIVAAAAAAAAAVAEETGVGLLPLAVWARLITTDAWFFQFALARSSRGAGGSFAAVVAAMCHSAWESEYHSRVALTWVINGLNVRLIHNRSNERERMSGEDWTRESSLRATVFDVCVVPIYTPYTPIDSIHTHSELA
jgi:hypothetical protein